MKARYVAGPLAALGLIAVSPELPNIKNKVYETLSGERQGIEHVVNSSETAYAQDNSLKTKPVNYDGLAKQVEGLIGSDPQSVIRQLEPYKMDKENKSTRFFNNLGAAYYSESKKRNDPNLLEESIRLLQISIEVDPNNESPHYNLGIAYNRKGMKAEAINQFRRVLGINQNHEGSKIWLLYLEK